MGRVRKQIYIDQEQEALLKRLAEETQLTEAEIVRQAIDRHARVLWLPRRDRRAWQQELELIDSLITQGAIEGRRTWRRDDLYER